MYPAVLVMYFISAAVILLASLALIAQVSLLFNDINTILKANFVSRVVATLSCIKLVSLFSSTPKGRNSKLF